MKTIKTTCKNCHKEFLADKKELRRGNAKFCDLSCSASYHNSIRSINIKIQNKCKHCGSEFISSNHSKYCSDSCKQKNYRLKKKSKFGFERSIEKLIREYPCEICNWDEAKRDSHHIIPVSENGKSTIENLISVCPNHHRMIHDNLISQDYLLEIVKSRTISSSLESLLIKIKSKEQDANSGY